MPQMSPMWWLTLTLMFNFMLLILMCMLYFNSMFKLTYLNTLKMKKMIWKW
uniref:ATP synthase F0 subunit 8 n=1 Tax=Hypsauchenia hardwickii TaxID=2605027 RepID=A0A5B9TCD9_9HEMI|nr:ATP synthase F0 subunit 8 [Hypsauchenia hardwickii]QEG98439.1 ATP synthase F0 subunit 8 [Hypsauchenia hardwickii]